MKLVIDRKVWLRGEGDAVSRLLRPEDQKMCCVGISGKALGLPDRESMKAGLHRNSSVKRYFAAKRRGCARERAVFDDLASTILLRAALHIGRKYPVSSQVGNDSIRFLIHYALDTLAVS